MDMENASTWSLKIFSLLIYVHDYEDMLFGQDIHFHSYLLFFFDFGQSLVTKTYEEFSDVLISFRKKLISRV